MLWSASIHSNYFPWIYFDIHSWDSFFRMFHMRWGSKEMVSLTFFVAMKLWWTRCVMAYDLKYVFKKYGVSMHTTWHHMTLQHTNWINTIQYIFLSTLLLSPPLPNHDGSEWAGLAASGIELPTGHVMGMVCTHVNFFRLGLVESMLPGTITTTPNVKLKSNKLVFTQRNSIWRFTHDVRSQAPPNKG